MAIIKILFVIMAENEALIKFVKTLQNQSLVHENKYIQKYMNALWVICYYTLLYVMAILWIMLEIAKSGETKGEIITYWSLAIVY